MGRSSKWILREATDNERQNWAQLVLQHEDSNSFLQLEQFARIKSDYGWNIRYMVFENGKEKIVNLVLEKKIAWLGLLWYMPKGPGVREDKELSAFVRALKQYITNQKLRVFMVKIEPPIRVVDTKGYELIPADAVQPIDATIILDIEKNPEKQLSVLGKRARRYIRKAEREGVYVKQEELTSASMRQMYSLMQTAFGGRGMPGLRPYEYYEDFWITYAEAGIGRLFFAYEDTQPVVGVFLINTGKFAVYKDGGSIPDRQSKGAAYRMHWHILNVLAKENAQHYDLWGSPLSKNVDNPDDPLYGIGYFKTAFSKTITDYAGAFDIVLLDFRYIFWRTLLYPCIVRCNKLLGRRFW